MRSNCKKEYYIFFNIYKKFISYNIILKLLLSWVIGNTRIVTQIENTIYIIFRGENVTKSITLHFRTNLVQNDNIADFDWLNA